MQSSEDSLVVLAARLSEAKREEENAKAKRILAEQAVIDSLDFDKREGSKLFEQKDSRGSVKLTLKQPINTSVDAGAWLSIRRKLAKDHPGRDIFIPKFSLDTKKARIFQKNCPEEWREVSGAIRRSPGKISVAISTLTIFDTAKE